MENTKEKNALASAIMVANLFSGANLLNEYPEIILTNPRKLVLCRPDLIW